MATYVLVPTAANGTGWVAVLGGTLAGCIDDGTSTNLSDYAQKPVAVSPGNLLGYSFADLPALAVGEVITGVTWTSIASGSGSPVLRADINGTGVADSHTHSSSTSPQTTSLGALSVAQVNSLGGSAGAFTGSGSVEYRVYNIFVTVTTAFTTPTQTVVGTLSGIPQVGNDLTATDGTWTNSSASDIRWLRNGSVIQTDAGATSSVYTVTGADVGCTISAENRGRNSGATAAYVANGSSVFVPSQFKMMM